MLQHRLFEFGKANQTYEIRMRSSDAQAQENTKLKETIDRYQSIFTNQQQALEFEKRQHAMAAQSLDHEFKCHAVTEKRLEQRDNEFLELVKYLPTTDIPRKVNQNGDKGAGTFYIERDSLMEELEQQRAKSQELVVEVQTLTSDLELKKQLIQELSEKLKIKPESRSIPPSSESSERLADTDMAVLLPAGPQKQRKRIRN